MRVLLTQRRELNRHGAPVDVLESAYLQFFATTDLLRDPILIPVPNHLQQAERLLRATPPDLLVLTGGNAVDPKDWGSGEEIEGLAPERDAVERMLLIQALTLDLPVLGICRGAQFMWTHFGGRLRLNLSDHPPAVPHTVRCGEDERTVNSYHDHGMCPDQPAKPLTPVAFAPDGVVEAFVSPKQRWLGVQWHPEREGADPQLFADLFKTNLRLGS